ncbi:iron uptake porin [Tolypothrix sp. PCC 7910]|uniref:iron uptake porin n=1 Tax=Tolypothrix sp. PCC 7910 TaxID=2099387 RepID=UPI0014278867|nr:iron uptake porin [Tolypothrix sp. PCC 7910]QIR37283.1 iron uptake porin [Tolypothrix sp. PCC 7910]
MRKVWKSLLAGSAVGGAMLFLGAAAVAGEISEPLVAAEQEQEIENPPQQQVMSQVTSVSQLSDVQPTDWAFQALQSLVERYGCIAGYPNGTFRGNRALTRYEFAAGLNACLNRVNELIATSTAELVTKEDLATLQRLQENFSAELATLRGRVDALEAKTAELEANQFSTTTKLNGEVVIALAGVVAGNTVNDTKVNRNIVLGNRVRLNFDTSFTGQDLLRTRLQSTNLDFFSNTATFTPEGDLRFAIPGDNRNSVGIDALLYQFPLGKNTTVTLEANAGAIDDFTNTVNPYIDGDGGSGALSQFGTRNPIYYLVNGTGIGIKHEFNDRLEISLGYLSNSAASPEAGSGLFNGAYGAMAQLTVKPSDQITLGLTYINAYNNNFFANGSGGSNNANNLLQSASSNSYGVEVSFQPSSKFVIGGWAGYTNARVLSGSNGDADIWNYALTLAFPDLGKKGNVAGIVVGMEPKVTGVSSSLSSAGINKDPNTSYHIEAFYQYKVSDNITITPGVIWLTAPDHNEQNDSVVIGALRTTFSF